jgi:DNA primase
MIDHFRLGFANRTLSYRLPQKNRRAGAEIRGRLERAGILRETTGHEHFNGSLVIPVTDLSGGIVGLYGRKITAGLREGTPLHLYLPGPHKGVWNEEALTVSKEIILCEALIDALTFWCAGFRNVTASYGVNGFTDDHRGAFQKHGIRHVWIAYDRDEAGDAAAERLKEELANLGIGSHRVLFPKGMDANEYARKVTPAAQSLAVLLNRAEWWEKSTPANATPEEPAAQGKSPETAASVIPLAAEPALEIRGEEITLWQGDRKYRVRGLGKNTSYEVMKVNVLVARQEEFHVDTFDMNLDRQRALFVQRAAEELHVQEEIIRKDIGLKFVLAPYLCPIG